MDLAPPRRYAVVRTDRHRKEFVLKELEAGRLRQGWGWDESQNLAAIASKAIAGERLTPTELSAWRNRRLLETQPDGLRPGDVIVIPNLPKQGLWAICRVAEGGYRFEISECENSNGLLDYGHIVPVRAVRDSGGAIAIVDPDNAFVEAPLRASMRNLSRMWSIDRLAAAVEKIIGAIEGGEDTRVVQPAAEKLEGMLAEARASMAEAIRKRYKAAELEQLVLELLGRIYPLGRVEHWGGPSEAGADLIVYTADALGLEYKVAVQVKCFDGVLGDVGALDQIRYAKERHRVDAGVVVTTASTATEEFERRREALEAELAMDIKLILRDELTMLVLQHLAAAARE